MHIWSTILSSSLKALLKLSKVTKRNYSIINITVLTSGSKRLDSISPLRAGKPSGGRPGSFPPGTRTTKPNNLKVVVFKQ